MFYAFPLLAIVSIACIVRLVSLPKKPATIPLDKATNMPIPKDQLPYAKQLQTAKALCVVLGLITLFTLGFISADELVLYVIFAVTVLLLIACVVRVVLLKKKQRAAVDNSRVIYAAPSEAIQQSGTPAQANATAVEPQKDRSTTLGILTTVCGSLFLSLSISLLNSAKSFSGGGIFMLLLLPSWPVAIVLQIVAIVGLCRSGTAKKPALAIMLNLAGLILLTAGFIVVFAMWLS